jgi:hypothetical protein
MHSNPIRLITRTEGGKNEGFKEFISKSGAVLGSLGLACGVHTLDEKFRLTMINSPF